MAFVIPFVVTYAAEIAAVAAVASAGAAIYSGVQASNAQKAQAKQAELGAISARQQANAAEESKRRENHMRQGQLRAAAAESGFDPTTGSLLDLQSKNAGELELDALNERYTGELQAIGLQNQASGFRSEATAARTTGYLSAAGSLLSGAGSYTTALKLNKGG